MHSFYEFTLPSFGDERGMLVPAELDEKFPIPVKRVYFLKDVPEGITRGAHCHHMEEEVFVCLQGQCRALIDEDGEGKKEYLLDQPGQAIFVGRGVWHEFDSFSDDSVLLAFSSTHYLPGETNYEANYEEFKRLKAEQ